MKYGYVRVSRGDDQTDPENQRVALRAEGVDVIYEDLFVGGVTGVHTRDGWKLLSSKLKPGDILVVTELARISRITWDTMQTVDELYGRGIMIHCLDTKGNKSLEYLALDPRTTEGTLGRMLALGMGVGAQMEREAIGRRTKLGLERARSQGKQVGGEFKLTPEQEMALVKDRETMSWKQLSRTYGVGVTTCKRIVARGPRDT